MIGPVMLFLLLVSAVASLAALAADHGLRRLGAPTRWVWLVAMGLGGVLLAMGGLLPSAPAGPAPGVMQPIELPPLVIGDGGAGGFLAVLPGALWALFTLGTTLVLVRTQRVLMRERRGWERRSVLGRDVFVSADRGPAVAGVVRPWIVLPRWVLGLSRRELGMVLLHEEEHLRARDCALLAAALTVVVLTAWNPVVWWQLRRLRTAMEMDCDSRVLGREPDAGTYGESLISVAARASGPSLGLAAFTERGLSLKQRIRAMTSRRTRWTSIGGALLLALAVLIGAQACFVEISVAVNKEDTPEAPPDAPAVLDPPAVDVPAERTDEATPPVDRVGRRPVGEEPTFTPMTIRPEIVNRDEVMRAMEREYPPLLRDAGIGGTVRVHFFVDETGTVQNTLIAESSGHRALDEAALKVASVYRFSPAMNRDQTVPVWVQFSITFQMR